MKNIWAPWRIQYITSDKPKGCIFCDMPSQDKDSDNLILYRGKLNYIIMNRYPYTGGHLMVVPYIHKSSLEGLDKDTLSEMMELARFSIDNITEVMHPEGFNTGINIGQAAGAGIKEHLHMHIVPRWTGDSNFMAVMDDISVIPEHLHATYDKLYEVFKINA